MRPKTRIFSPVHAPEVPQRVVRGLTYSYHRCKETEYFRHREPAGLSPACATVELRRRGSSGPMALERARG